MNIIDIKDEIDIHFKRIDSILPEIENLLPLKTESLEMTETIKTIDSFIYRFTKVQDKMGEKLFPAILEKLQEYKNSMPFIDVLNRLEKLELLKSANDWIDYRKLRNTLTHEYPDNTDEIIEAIEKALNVYNEIKIIYEKLLNVGLKLK